SKLWICCLLDFKGVQRDPMPPGRWTALFFLDEATALAAGHRPCGYCRRGDFLAFAEAWRAALGLPRRRWAAEMDTALHRERTDRSRRKLSYLAPAAELPDGVMIRIAGEPGLLAGGRMRPWSFRGYGAPAPADPAGQVEVLTPPSIVAAIAAGYRPLVHPSGLAGAPPTRAPPTPAPPPAAPPPGRPPATGRAGRGGTPQPPAPAGPPPRKPPARHGSHRPGAEATGERRHPGCLTALSGSPGGRPPGVLRRGIVPIRPELFPHPEGTFEGGQGRRADLLRAAVGQPSAGNEATAVTRPSLPDRPDRVLHLDPG